MESFVLTIPVKIIFGSETLELLKYEVSNLMKKPAILTGKNFFINSGLKERINKILGDDISISYYSEVSSNPTDDFINKLSEKIKKDNCDGIIGIGGGSVMDSAKAVSMLLNSDKTNRILDYISEYSGESLEFPGRVPLILIPTTSATGSEANCGMVINDENKKYKITYFHPGLYSDVSIIDPKLTLTLSNRETFLGIFDTFCHIYESYITGSLRAVISENISITFMKRILELALLVKDDPYNIDTREELSYISMMGLSGIPDAGLSGVYPLHDLAAQISIRLNLSHGFSLALLFKEVANFIKSGNGIKEKFEKLNRELFNGEDFIEKITEFIEKYLEKEEYSKIDSEIVKDMAYDAIDLFGGGNIYVDAPVKIRISDIINIYERSL